MTGPGLRLLPGTAFYQEPNLRSFQTYRHRRLLCGNRQRQLEKRSQTTGSELHLSVVDGDVMPGAISGAPVSVCRFAKELRIALWGEHLGITDPAKLEAVLAADVVKQASTFLGRL